MIEDLITRAINELAKILGLSGDNALQQAAQNLFTLPGPDLSNPAFKAIYAIMWGGGLLLGLVAGVFCAALVLGSKDKTIGAGLPVAHRATFFLRVLAMGFFLPMLVGLSLWVAHEVTLAVSILPGFDSSHQWTSGLVDAIMSPDDAVMALVANGVAWITARGITFETAFVLLWIYPSVVLSPTMYALSVVPKIGLRMWRIWCNLLLISIFAKPVIAWTLGIGNIFVTGLSSYGLTAISGAGGIIAAITLILALLAPLGMLWMNSKLVTSKLGPAFATVSGNVRADSDEKSGSSLAQSALALGTAKLGALAARNMTSGDTPLQQPASVRVKTTQAMTGVASVVSKSHPVMGTVVTAGTLLLGQTKAKPPPVTVQQVNSQPPPDGPRAIASPPLDSNPYRAPSRQTSRGADATAPPPTDIPISGGSRIKPPMPTLPEDTSKPPKGGV